MDPKGSDFSTPDGEFVNIEGNDEFYDAVGTDSSSSSDDDDSDNEVELNSKVTNGSLNVNT